MRIYIVRHGESEDMAKKLHQRGDSPLTPAGLRQAEIVAKRFKDIPVDYIWASPLIRAYQTAEAIAKELNLKIVTEPLLEEEKRPTEMEGLKRDSKRAKEIRLKIMQNFHNSNFRFSDEHTFEDLKLRAIGLKSKLVKLGNKDIVLVTHGIMAKAFLTAVVLGDSFDSYSFERINDTFELTKTGLCVIGFTREKGWRVVTWNDQVHLGE
jgi:phosphoserine phosphatase